MSWTWDQATGALSRNGKVLATGYSGCGAGKNNPAMQNVARVGPIPRGRYLIGSPRDDSEMGHYVLDLVPEFGNEMHNRSGFAIHGRNPARPEDSSRGCPVLDHEPRETVWKSGDHHLVVA